MRKPLLVHPGPTTSVHDTFVGLAEALRASGLPLAEFRLDGRLAAMEKWAHVIWRQQKKTRPDRHWPKPTPEDIVLQSTWGLVERALERECDSVLVVTAMFLNPTSLVIAKRAGLKVYLICTESPYHLSSELGLASLVDGLWTNERSSLPDFQAICPQSAYLPHAWRSGIHDAPHPGDRTLPAHDVVFVGTYFPERIALLEAVDWTGIDLGLYGNTQMIPGRSPIFKYVRGGVTPNAIAAGYYRRAKIGLNLYRTSPEGTAPAESMNPRAYELAASGICQVSEYRAEIAEVFGESVATFTTAAELEAQIRSLLAADAQRAVMGHGAQGRSLSHTWTTRVAQMRRDLNQWTAQPSQSLGITSLNATEGQVVSHA